MALSRAVAFLKGLMHLTGRKVVEYIPSQFFVLMRDAAFPAP
jgi:hypothetical protein